jgi:hypothetical protein
MPIFQLYNIAMRKFDYFLNFQNSTITNECTFNQKVDAFYHLDALKA